MPALPNALAPQSSPLKALSPAGGTSETFEKQGETPSRSFEDAVQEQSEPENNRPGADDVPIDKKADKPDLIPVADGDNGKIQASLIDIDPEMATTSPDRPQPKLSQDTPSTPILVSDDLEVDVAKTDSVLTVASTSPRADTLTTAQQPGPAAALVPTQAEQTAAHSSKTGRTAAASGPTVAPATADVAPAILSTRAAETAQTIVASQADPAKAASATQTVTAIPAAPLASGQGLDSEPPVPTRTAEQAVELSEKAATIKTPVAGSDTARLADVSTVPTATTATSDSTVSIKSLPVIPATPAVTPLAGMSERLAASVLQSTQASVPVTLDKIPQAVVTVALTARSATLQIDPPELGRIQLDYQFDLQGRTVVTLTPESDAARAALADRMASITAALQAQAGGEIDVKLGSSQDFGAEHGQAAQADSGQDGRSSGDTSGAPGDGAQSANDRALMELQRYAQAAASGDTTRLHILV